MILIPPPALDTGTVPQQFLQFVGIKVFDHVGGVDGIDRTAGEGQATADVEPNVSLLHRVGVDVDEAVEVFRSASQVKIEAVSVDRSSGVTQLFQPVIRPRCLCNQKEVKILVALMQHTNLSPRNRGAWSLVSERGQL